MKTLDGHRTNLKGITVNYQGILLGLHKKSREPKKVPDRCKYSRK